MNTWNLRKEIAEFTQRWYWIAGAFLAGSLLGVLISFIWPAPFRASLDVYVGLNANRAVRDLYVAQVAEQEFRNLDDYKNWQMGQLNALALSDEYLDETLNRLRATDSSWLDVDLVALRGMAAVNWRNTGEWHFTMTAPDPESAREAVSVWAAVVFEKTNAAVDQARQAAAVEPQISSTAQTQTELRTRQEVLNQVEDAMGKFQVEFAETPDREVSPDEHWEILALATSAADWSPSWQELLDAAPAPGSAAVDYVDWIEQVLALIEAEVSTIPGVISELDATYQQLLEGYEQSVERSRGLSASLEVGQIKDDGLVVERLRPTPGLLLVGGFMGVLVLTLGWLIWITRRTA